MVSRELLKGSLKSIVLKLLAEHGRMYGYEITQKVAILTQGQITLTYGALYPVLHKLEKEGALLTESEIINNRNRIYYKLTKKGNETAREKIKELEDFINTIGILLKPDLGIEPCS
ncbi:MAG TPA: PadR family transcriptional regulator [Bacteroidales bacterium]|jgi:DNA-binding PadR family transcriptional regulator|nr:PadR family transcriptional regulator [Bacteroidales bacterium]